MFRCICSFAMMKDIGPFHFRMSAKGFFIEKTIYTNIKDDLINFDNSKFEKYDTEQYRYGLIKDYSFIHPEKSERVGMRILENFMAVKGVE